MARKTTESSKTEKTPKAESRVPLKDAPTRTRGTRGSARPDPGQKPLPDTNFDDMRQPLIFDDRTKRDITGVCFGVSAVILFVLATMEPGGILTSALSHFIHNLLGLGAYGLPFLLFIIGGTFLTRSDHDYRALRFTVGSVMIFMALLGFFALFTPSISEDPMILFQPEQLPIRGGWLGAGMTWLLLRLFGKVVSIVLLTGLAVGGAVIIGFSISGSIEKILAKAKQLKIEYGIARERKKEEEDSLFGTPEYNNVQPTPIIKRYASKFGLPSQPFGFKDGSDTKLVGEKAISGPETQDVDMYWPDECSYDDSIEAKTNDADEPMKAMTRKLKRRKLGDAPESPAGNMSKAETQKLTEKPAASPKGRKAMLSSAEVRNGFVLPPAMCLKTTKQTASSRASENELRERAQLLQNTLGDFNIMAQVVGWVAGPTVTLFKVDLPSGVRVNRITALEDDIALALASPGVRIFAPIPGTNYVGIEVPNVTRENVLLGDVIKHAQGGPLEIAIGKDVEGNAIVTDLAKMPHLLIGGTTGSGKSVAINSMIMSILMRSTPDEVRFIMIDPKRVEFTPYNGIPHLYVPVVTENKEAASALAWGVAEMELRLKTLSKAGVRNINQYNEKVASGELEPEEGSGQESPKKMPYIVIVIDELADLMMNVGKEVEFSISRIAQLARAAGIHLIVATQRPSTNVVTGLIKANITNRIAFNVASGIDSRVILDTPGAENLIGLGDMLFSKPEYPKPQRLQGCFVSEKEIEDVVEYLKSQGEPEYHQEILKTNLIDIGNASPDGSGGTATANDDPLLWEAAEIVVSSGMGSTSNIQRRLSVGYSRAGRIMDTLEEKGIVGPPNGSKPREVLVDTMELETIKAFEMNDANNDSCPF